MSFTESNKSRLTRLHSARHLILSVRVWMVFGVWLAVFQNLGVLDFRILPTSDFSQKWLLGMEKSLKSRGGFENGRFEVFEKN